MRRTCRTRLLRPIVLTAPWLLASAGCGGAGTETAHGPDRVVASLLPVTPQAQKPEANQDKGKPGSRKGADLVTPDRVIDPKAVVDVVKEEVKGGENASGGSPLEYLWQSPDFARVKDEPMTVDVPAGLQPLLSYVPASNPITKAKAELGKQLYFDPRISLNATVSCATCHNPARGWTDGLKTSVGVDGQGGGRNAPTVLNTVYGKSMFWDGRAPSLEGQSQGPPQNPIEMGNQSYKDIVERLRKVPGYKEQFAKVFGTDVTLDGIAKAVATFERVSALTGNSPYDKYSTGQLDALNDAQKRGMVLFGLRPHPDDETEIKATLKKAECTSCHNGFNFTDEAFHNLGIGWDESKKKFADSGRLAIDPIGAKNTADYGAFKTPTVRDATRTGPYMHDGSLKTLEEVMDHYDKGGTPNPTLDKEMKKLNLTSQEKADVIEFMKALTGESPKVALPTLPPGPDGKAPNPADALATPTAKTARNAAPHGFAVSAR